MSTKNQKLDPRVKRSRQLLRDALVALIPEKGYDAITVQDITELATLNRATFYLHYRDKHDLMRQSIDEILNDLLESISPFSTENADDDFDFTSDKPHPTFIHLFEQIAQHEAFYRVMLGEKGMPHFTSRLMEVIAAFISKGITIVQPDDKQLTVPRDILIRYISAAFLGVIIWWLENDMPYTPKYMATQLMRLATHGPYTGGSPWRHA
ncbi:TetR/AcrR family transcriptional regulator [Aneurinibacillus migulanus]|uniref:TetR/AcrR family transcriptional regulator n=1 Tax=Aneurinibacillus migulanus TaxID=47500 RepID=UPI002E2114E3|nr:TetR/AcrR family transcriptional regulator [Aneurinibacillus migulanus]